MSLSTIIFIQVLIYHPLNHTKTSPNNGTSMHASGTNSPPDKKTQRYKSPSLASCWVHKPRRRPARGRFFRKRQTTPPRSANLNRRDFLAEISISPKMLNQHIWRLRRGSKEKIKRATERDGERGFYL